MVRIGILAVQGAFIEHQKMLNKLGVSSFEIRQIKDIQLPFDGLILPGGESTAMRRLLDDLHLFEPLKRMIEDGLPVLGTCAGLILLADTIEDTNQAHFRTLDVAVKRNAYGRQLGSFRTQQKFNGKDIEMVFIRAPYVSVYGPSVEVLAEVNNHVVAVRQGNQIGVAFHPELTNDASVHELFLTMIELNKK
jgi:pyridoxal 5'-phosphate synthase pdxT subunit